MKLAMTVAMVALVVSSVVGCAANTDSAKTNEDANTGAQQGTTLDQSGEAARDEQPSFVVAAKKLVGNDDSIVKNTHPDVNEAAAVEIVKNTHPPLANSTSAEVEIVKNTHPSIDVINIENANDVGVEIIENTHPYLRN